MDNRPESRISNPTESTTDIMAQSAQACADFDRAQAECENAMRQLEQLLADLK